MLYVGSAAYACYLETLSRFRPDLSFYADLADINGPNDHVAQGIVPGDWRDNRRLGSATVTGDHADIGHSVWLATVRRQLAGEIRSAGFTDFDAHVLYTTAPRSLTQQISRIVFENRLDGIRYVSKYGSEAECWAVFEGRVTIRDDDEGSISAADPELQSAMTTFDLKFSDHGLSWIERFARRAKSHALPDRLAG